MTRALPDPDEWQSRAGLGTCFHQALTRYGQRHASGDYGWRIAVGVVRGLEGTRNVHAWLERGETVISAISGDTWPRFQFYARTQADPRTVRLINPRKILRMGPITTRSVDALLRAWGGDFIVLPSGGVVAPE